MSSLQATENDQVIIKVICLMHLTPGVVHNFPKAVGV